LRKGETLFSGILSRSEETIRHMAYFDALTDLPNRTHLHDRLKQAILAASYEKSSMGIQLSIDDFGTGYSSLGYLKKLPVNQIKIDKSFTKEMALNTDDAIIVRSTIELGHNLGLKGVAEGVESQETWERLLSLACDEAQGYYINHPLPAPELNCWLSEAAPLKGWTVCGTESRTDGAQS
jgi:EAL domain-containing protein (putative c-di-GMP-specific phosphodiesterase class I)